MSNIVEDSSLHDLAGRGHRWAELLDYMLAGLSVDEASVAMGVTLDRAVQLRSDIVTALKRRAAIADGNTVSVKLPSGLTTTDVAAGRLLQDDCRALSKWFSTRLGAQFHRSEGRRRS